MKTVLHAVSRNCTPFYTRTREGKLPHPGYNGKATDCVVHSYCAEVGPTQDVWTFLARNNLGVRQFAPQHQSRTPYWN